jgi:RHS repeat-associated protein
MATYGYNGLNQRVKKTTGTTVTTSFFNQNWQELESKTGNDITIFIWGLRYVDDLVLREKGTEKLYSLADPNWNVVAITNAAGVVQERMRYDAFGKVTWLDAAFATKANSGFAWNRTFTGQVLDAETGLMLYRNRFYHTGLGRFVQRDPIGYEANDVSLYRYVENMPNVYTDPMGFMKPDHLMPGQPDNPHGRRPGWPPPRPEPDLDAMCKCVDTSPECEGCDEGMCKQVLERIITAVDDTPSPPWWHYDKCSTWAGNFLFQLGPSTEPCLSVMAEWYDYPNPIPRRWSPLGVPGHHVIRVTSCNGQEFCADRGTFGSVFSCELIDRNPHLTPGEIPYLPKK